MTPSRVGFESGTAPAQPETIKSAATSKYRRIPISKTVNILPRTVNVTSAMHRVETSFARPQLCYFSSRQTESMR